MTSQYSLQYTTPKRLRQDPPTAVLCFSAKMKKRAGTRRYRRQPLIGSTIKSSVSSYWCQTVGVALKHSKPVVMISQDKFDKKSRVTSTFCKNICYEFFLDRRRYKLNSSCIDDKRSVFQFSHSIAHFFFCAVLLLLLCLIHPSPIIS